MIIIIDLDDTVLTKDKRVTPYTKKVFQRLKADGHLIIINSARHYHRVKEYINDLGVSYCVCNAGTYVCDKKGNILFEDPLDNVMINKLYKELIKATNGIYYQGKDYIYSSDYKIFAPVCKDRQKPLIIPFKENCYKIVVYVTNEEQANKIKKTLEKYPLNLHVFVNDVFGKISHNSVNKYTGLKVLLDKLNLSFDDCMAFGDDICDKEFMSHSKIRICPNTSVKEIKEIATDICDSSNNNGVAKYLNDYFHLNIK